MRAATRPPQESNEMPDHEGRHRQKSRVSVGARQDRPKFSARGCMNRSKTARIRKEKSKSQLSFKGTEAVRVGDPGGLPERVCDACLKPEAPVLRSGRKHTAPQGRVLLPPVAAAPNLSKLHSKKITR